MKNISYAHPIVTVMMLQPIATQKMAPTQAGEMDEAEEQDFEGVADIEEWSEEDEEYDTETEFLAQ